MRKFINKLREKPPHIRDQIAIFSAMMFAGIVAFFWLASLTADYASPETKSSFNESFSPFRIFGANVKDALNRSKAQLSSIDPASGNYGNTAVSVDESGVVQLGVPAE